MRIRMVVKQQHYDTKPETIVEVVGVAEGDTALNGKPYLVCKLNGELRVIPEYKMEKL